MITHPRPFLFVLAALAIVGAGCLSGSVVPATSLQKPSGPVVSTFDGLTPEQSTAKINFVAGTSLEIRQTFLGFGANIAAKLAGDNKDGVRVVIIDRFAPMNTANLSWKLSTKVESAKSKTARAEATRLRKPIPEPVMVEQISEGNLDGIDIKSSHSLFVPSYWPEKAHAPAFSSSAIWLSADVFEDLARNRVSTLSFGLLDQTLQGPLSKAADFATALSNMQDQVKSIENRVDVNKIDGDKDLVDWPLKVNGVDIKVQVIKAHNWFGDIVVLNNKQNPLVLKLTLNPLVAGTRNLFSGVSLIKSLVGYEVTSLNGVQE